MTLKVAVIAEGNASGAVKAMDQTAAAVGKVDAANRNVAASTNEVASAALREQAATTQASAAARVHEQALRGQAAAARLAAMNQRNLAFQMNDVVVSLISGQALWMVAAQQGAQIAQIYGPGEGGAGRAFREMGSMATTALTKMGPLIAATALFSVGVAGMTKEINRAGGAQASFGDVALGIFQTIADRLYGLVRPAIEGVGAWVTENWSTIVAISKNVGNAMVGTFVLAIENIKSAFAVLPAVMGDLMFTAAQNVMNGITWMVRNAVTTLNGLIASANTLLAKVNLPAIGDLGDPSKLVPDIKVENPFAGAMGGLMEQFQKNAASAYGKDYMGDFFADVSAHARSNAANRAQDAKAKPVSDYAREITQIRERTAALEIERRTIGLSTFDATKLQKVFELENAARKDSIGLTAARIVEIQREATVHAAAAVALENTKFAYDTFRDTVTGFFSDLRSNVREGKGLWDSLAEAGVNAAMRLTDALADKALLTAINMVFNAVSGMGSNFIGGTAGAPGLQLGYQVGVAHSGGTIGRTSLPTRTVSPNIFANAPRLHSGLAPDEFPAILQTGEEVVPRGGGRSGGVVVQHKTEIHNYSGAAVREERAGPSISRIIIGEVGKGLASGAFDSALTSSFGIRRKGH